MSGGGGSGAKMLDKDPTFSLSGAKQLVEQVVIDSKKVSNQLGAQMGMYPSTGVTKKMAAAATPAHQQPSAIRKKRKTSFKNRNEKQMQQLQASQSQCGVSGDFSSSRRENASHNYSTVSNEESSSSIVLDYDYVNLAIDKKNTQSSVSNEPSSGVGPAAGSLLAPVSAFASSSQSKVNSKANKLKTFSLPLNVIMQMSGQPLPQQILEAMRLVRRMAPNEVGIFRKNGNKARINRIRELIDKNESINFQTAELSIFDIADTIKLYFRELPECLITNKISNILLWNYTSLLNSFE
jgi:hypothetical protein